MASMEGAKELWLTHTKVAWIILFEWYSYMRTIWIYIVPISFIVFGFITIVDDPISIFSGFDKQIGIVLIVLGIICAGVLYRRKQ